MKPLRKVEVLLLVLRLCECLCLGIDTLTSAKAPKTEVPPARKLNLDSFTSRPFANCIRAPQ